MGETSMSRTRVARDFYRKKARKKINALQSLISSLGDEQFLSLCWAVNMLQSDFGTDLRRDLIYPEIAKTTNMASPYAVYKWEIELLVNIMLNIRNGRAATINRKFLEPNSFNTMIAAVNLLRSIENSEAAIDLNDESVLLELHRIAQRQFGWQRGFGSSERLCRFAYIYAQGDCADYFEEKYSINVQDFIRVGFVLYAHLHRSQWVKPVESKNLGVSISLIEKTLQRISLPLDLAKEKALQLTASKAGRAPGKISYTPSVLREFPIITNPGKQIFLSPLPQLIILRITAGLYYDICGGPTKILEDANKRFEEYARLCFRKFFPRFCVSPAVKYGSKKNLFESPDIIISESGNISIIIECKATKLTYEAQYSESPFDSAKRAYNQLVKGVVQIWRFISHLRQGVFPHNGSSSIVYAVLLTLDSWMPTSEQLRQKIIQEARNEAKVIESIKDEDMHPIVFCSMQDLVDVMFISNEDQFMRTLYNARLEKYMGWGLREVRREVEGEEKGRTFPLDVSDVLPWWGELRKMNGILAKK